MLKQIGELRFHFLDDHDLKSVEALTDAGFTMVHMLSEDAYTHYAIAIEVEDKSHEN